MRFRVRNRHSLAKFFPVVTGINLLLLFAYCLYEDYSERLGWSTLSFHSRSMTLSELRFVERRWTVNWTKCAEAMTSDVTNQNVSALWIYPTSFASKMTSSRWLTPRNWTMFVPQELSREVICDDGCRMEDPNDFNPIWERWHFTSSESQRNDIHRKLATFLIIIKSGTQAILLTSDPTSTTKSMSRLIHDNNVGGVVGLEYVGDKLVFDYYHYHHRPWNESSSPCQYKVRKRMTPLWTIGIRCRSVISLSSDGKGQTTTEIDFQSPPVFTSIPKFVVENISDGYFNRQGMWALFISIFKSNDKVNAWGFWAQRMLQEINGEMALTPLSCPPGRRGKVMKKIDPDEKSLQIFEFIKQWRCGRKKSFFNCAKILAKEMKVNGFLDPGDVGLLYLWIQSLETYAAYSEPQRIGKSKLSTSYYKYMLPFCVIHSPAFVSPSKAQMKTFHLFPNIQNKFKSIRQLTSKLNSFSAYNVTKLFRLRDIALVIVLFNSTFFDNIPYLQDLYAKHFSTIIYCGPFQKIFREFQRDFDTPVSFIEVAPTNRHKAYDCVTRAMLLNYDVSGYLEITDDVLLNTWNFRHLPREQFWWQKNVYFTDNLGNQSSNDNQWQFNGGIIGQKALEKSMSSFVQIENRQEDTREVDIVTSFKKTLQHNSDFKNGVFYSHANIFYVPTIHRQRWCMLAETFSRNNLISAIAVPTLIYGLDFTKNVFHLNGNYLLKSNRTDYKELYNTKHHFIHPWKISLLDNLEYANFLYKKVLPQIVNDLTQPVIQKKGTSLKLSLM